MNTNNNYRFLSLNQRTIRANDLEQLVSMWSVISKCKDHLEEGSRLENMSWRLWHQKHQHRFVLPTLSLSAGKPHHEVSQAKQTQNNHVPDTDGWPFSLITTPTTKAETAGSTNALAPSTAVTTIATTTTSSSRTTTPSLSNSYQYGDGEYDDDDDDDDALYDEDYDDDILDNDDLYDENDNYIYDEELFMHHQSHAEKLRPYRSSEHYFEKTRPQPLIQQPSLLSALFKTSTSSSPSSSSASSSNAITPPPASTFRHTFTVPNAAPPPDHFLKKEWTESLRDNVLWEHVQQQKPLYTTRSHPSYYHHPPPTSVYQPPYRHTNSYSYNHRFPSKKTTAPSDQGWLESFHGW